MFTDVMNNNLKDKTVLVTGGAKRIGRAIAGMLAEQGLNLVIHYRSSKEKARDLQQELSSSENEVFLAQADFKADMDYSSFLGELAREVGKIDFLVNNASIFPRSHLDDLSFRSLTENLRVNSWAPFALTRSFVDRFQSGGVINILDTRVAGYDWNHVGYYFSKVLLERMTKMTALHWSPNFRVNGVAPGLIIPPEGEDNDYLESQSERVPLRTHGEKKDVARAVLYLLGAEFVTGQIIFVDGGRNLLHELEG